MQIHNFHCTSGAWYRSKEQKLFCDYICRWLPERRCLYKRGYLHFELVNPLLRRFWRCSSLPPPNLSIILKLFLEVKRLGIKINIFKGIKQNESQSHPGNHINEIVLFESESGNSNEKCPHIISAFD